MVEDPKDPLNPSDNESQQQVLSALAGGLISYIRTEGRSIDSVKKSAPTIAKSNASNDCIPVDLAWILDETNPLLEKPDLVFEDLAIAIDLLENLHSVIASILNESVSLPSDPKISHLLFYYVRLARTALSAQPILLKRKSNKKLAKDIEAFLIQAKGLSGLTPEQDTVADKLGNEFAQKIIDRGQQGRYKKDKVNYIRQKLDSGKLV